MTFKIPLFSLFLLLASVGSPHALHAQSAAEKEYESKLRKADQESVDDLLELATWCRGK